MTKRRPPGSRHEAVFRAAADLDGFAAMAAVLGRTESYVRDASDPDRDGDLRLAEVLAVEAALLRAGRTGHFRALLEMVHERAQAPEPQGGVIEHFLQANGAWGDLCAAVRHATSSDSDGKRAITVAEARDLLAALDQHDGEARALRHKLHVIIAQGRAL